MINSKSALKWNKLSEDNKISILRKLFRTSSNSNLLWYSRKKLDYFTGQTKESLKIILRTQFNKKGIKIK